MEPQEGGGGRLESAEAVAACGAMAVMYVAVLYFPTLILRLAPPDSFETYMMRRFVCAAVSSVASLVFSFLILPVGKWDVCILFGIYGIRLDHIWQALVFPLLLTSLMYSGTFTQSILSILQERNGHLSGNGNRSTLCMKRILEKITDSAVLATYSVSAWRNYVVAPITEELVFRACMIPLLLCGGFSTYNVIFLCPIIFSLAHLNHLLELCVQKKTSFPRACRLVGVQLGYTVVFGAYASFLFVRTGHLAAPLVAHIFCNFMNLPVIFSRPYGLAIAASSLLGMLGFVAMLFPLSDSHLYNDQEDECRCWHRYCDWT